MHGGLCFLLVLVWCTISTATLTCPDLHLLPVTAVLKGNGTLTVNVDLGDETGNVTFCASGTAGSTLMISPDKLTDSGSVVVSSATNFRGLGQVEISLSQARGSLVCNKKTALPIWVEKTTGDPTRAAGSASCNSPMVDMSSASIVQEATTAVFFRTTVADCPDHHYLLPSNGYCEINPNFKVHMLDLWLKAESLQLDSGAVVVNWNDTSPQRRSFTNVMGAQGATYHPNVVNGRPVVRFFTNGWFSSDGGGYDLDTASGLTIVFVAKTNHATGTVGTIYGWQSNAATQTHYAVQSRHNNYVAVADTTGVSRILATAPTLASSNFAVTTMFLKGNNSTLRTNGVTICSYDATGITDYSVSHGMASIGSHSGSINKFDGDLAELMVFKGPLAPDNLLAVESYLLLKYGIAGTSTTSTC
mmetsp:Transcript_5565/g.12709  ORF Transcript_5565/g.12709 Transcript_5565/m.12709 type:complete len:417 (+) Transcript_5565:20-1270(+)